MHLSKYKIVVVKAYLSIGLIPLTPCNSCSECTALFAYSSVSYYVINFSLLVYTFKPSQKTGSNSNKFSFHYINGGRVGFRTLHIWYYFDIFCIKQKQQMSARDSNTQKKTSSISITLSWRFLNIKLFEFFINLFKLSDSLRTLIVASIGLFFLCLCHLHHNRAFHAFAE